MRHSFTPQAIVVGIEAPDPESKDLKTKDQKKTAKEEAEKKHLPYVKAKCDDAWTALKRLNGDASPAALAEINDAVNASIDRCPYSLQQHELLDFFDTDANLSLGFTDVSPFVRGIDPETDVYVAWRDWPGSDKGERPNFSADFQREELCPVSIGKVRDARALLSKGWIWRGKEAGWGSVQSLDVVPGMTILLPVTAGGYHEDSGWTGREEDKPVASVYEPSDTPSDEEMLSSLNNGWQSIAQHTDDVTLDWECIIGALEGVLALSRKEQSAALTATHWHDIGKNHSSWQFAAKDALTKAGIPIPQEACPLAKFSLSESPRLREQNDDGTPKFTGYELKKELRALRQSFKPGLAHEVASALAFRQSEQAAHGTQRPIESLLAEYLIMSHHGRVRKVLRDEIPRQPKNQKDQKLSAASPTETRWRQSPLQVRNSSALHSPPTAAAWGGMPTEMRAIRGEFSAFLRTMALSDSRSSRPYFAPPTSGPQFVPGNQRGGRKPNEHGTTLSSRLPPRYPRPLPQGYRLVASPCQMRRSRPSRPRRRRLVGYGSSLFLPALGEVSHDGEARGVF